MSCGAKVNSEKWMKNIEKTFKNGHPRLSRGNCCPYSRRLEADWQPFRAEAPEGRVVVVSSTAHLGANKELMEGQDHRHAKRCQAYCQG